MSEHALTTLVVALLVLLGQLITGLLNYSATVRNRKDIGDLKVQLNGSLQAWLDSEKTRSREEGYKHGFEDGWRQAGC